MVSSSYSTSSSESTTATMAGTINEDNFDGGKYSLSQSEKTAVIVTGCLGGILILTVIILVVALKKRKRAVTDSTGQDGKISEDMGHSEQMEISEKEPKCQIFRVESSEMSV